MKYNKFKNICDKCILLENKKNLLIDIVEYQKVNLYDNTYKELFLKKRIIEIQNNNFDILFKKLFEEYFTELNYKNLDRKIKLENNEYLDLDQIFTNNKYIYFMEQKVRDDHDSTKKRGQIENFEKKINQLLKIYKENEIKSYMYFIDPSLIKNKNFYIDEIDKIKNDYNVYSKLCYGEEFWKDINHIEVWEEILKYLKDWKKEIPDMPSVNFDENYEESFNEIKDLEPIIFRKLFDNKEICKEILPILFPTNKVLKLLKEYFLKLGENKTIYKNIAEKINL